MGVYAAGRRRLDGDDVRKRAALEAKLSPAMAVGPVGLESLTSVGSLLAKKNDDND